MGLRSFYRTIALWLSLTSLCYGQWQPITAVKTGAQFYLTETLKANYPHYKSTVTVNNIDSRLKLLACDKPLTYQLHDKSLRASNVTIKAQCLGQVQWSFYLTARVALEGEVLVASRDLARHETLNESDVRLEFRTINTASHSTLTTIKSAIGQQTKKPIRANELIKSSNLTAPQVIQRGDLVTITALSNGISVATAGTAMANGKVGEQIRVQNNRTDRVIKARVSAAGQVQISL
jgi:flagellar basal body P-ring formation protein FlgA